MIKEFIKRNWKWFLVISYLVVRIVYPIVDSSTDGYMKYDKLVTSIQKGEVEKIVTTDSSNDVTVHLKNKEIQNVIVPSSEELSRLVTKQVEDYNNGKGYYIEYEVKPKKIEWIDIFSSLAHLALLGYVVYLIKKHVSIYNSDEDEVEMFEPERSKICFDDVAGIEEEKEQVQEVVRFLKHPEKYQEAGAKIPKGILLTGNPGTGKTLLAKAIAGEAGVPFFQVTGSSFDERWIGVGAARVRDLFDKAREVAPSIIFIDEIDSVAKERYSDYARYNEQTLNQLLAEMDGFETDENIVVIAATNYMEVLDPAIIRSGRFDRKIHIPTPDPVAREKILKVHAKDKHFEKDVSLKEIAQRTTGFAGADLENILNEAAIRSVNQGRKLIKKSDIEEAILRTTIGLEKRNVVVSEDDRYITAIHEAGHAIVSAILRPNATNFGISIIQRGGAGGYNIFNEVDSCYESKEDLVSKIKTIYAGRAAEEIILNKISTGASSDFEKASKIVYQMMNVFGMFRKLVKITNKYSFSETLEQGRVEAMEELCDIYYNETIEIVKAQKSTIIELAKLLMEKETLNHKQVAMFMKENLKN